jgi:hypothetical protein
MGIKYDGLKLVWLHQFGGSTTLLTWVSPDEGDVGSFVGGAKAFIPAAVRVINGPRPTFSLSSGSLPTGLSLDTSSGAVSGILNNIVGSYSYTLKAQSGQVSVERTFSANVAVNQAPVWNTPAGSLGSQFDNTPVNLTLDAVDPEAQPVTFALIAGSLPGGLNLSNTGAITGLLSPVTDDTTFFFTLTASDGVLNTQRAFSFTALLDQAPVWSTHGNLGTPIESSAFTFPLVVTGARALTYTVTGGQLPVGLTLDANTGVISGTTPAVALDSTSTFIVSASDGVKATAQTLSIIVKKNLPPVWSSSGTVATDFGGKAVNFNLIAVDPNGSSVTFTLGNGSVLPGDLTLSNTGLISGNLPDVVASTDFSFTAVASDGLLTTPRALKIRTLLNQPPVWDTASGLSPVLEEMAFTRVVSAHDPAGVQAIHYKLASGSLPDGVTLSNNGVISGTPGTVVSDTEYDFNIEANNGVLAASQDFTLIVAKNVAPVWSSNAGLINTVQGLSIYNYNLSGHDGNGTIPVYTLTAGALPDGISLSTSGTLSGTVGNVANATQYDFTVALNDGFNAPVGRSFSIIVTPNALPVWVTNSGTIASAFETAPISVFINAFDPEGAQITYYMVGSSKLPDGVFLNGSTGLISGSLPNVTEDTDFSFNIYADDGTPNNARRAARIFTIHTVFNSAPVFQTPANLGTSIEGRNYSLQLSATGVGNGPMIYTLSSGTLPAGLTLSRSGLISGVLPAAATDTGYTFTVNAFNGIKNATRTFTLTVAHDLPPVWTSNAGTLGSFFGNNAFSIQLASADPNGVGVVYSLANATTLPHGVSLSTGGLVSGSLDIVANNTTYNFTVRSSDGVLSADRSFSLTSLAEVAPNWVTPAGQIAQVFKNTSYSSFLVAADSQHLPITYTVVSGSLPTGLTLNANTGLLAGITANVSINTEYDFTVRASNGTLTSDRAFSFVVQSVATPAWVTPAGSLGSILSGYTGVFSMVATDPQGLSLTYSFISGTLPAGLSFSGGGSATIQKSSPSATVPVTSSDQTYSFTVEVTNGFVPVQRTFSITILKNLPPVWVSPTAGSLGTQNEGTSFTVTLDATDPESQGIFYLVSAGSLPNGFGLNANTGVISGTTGTVSNTTTFNFTIDADDGKQTTSRAFSFTTTFSSAPAWTTASGSLASQLEQTPFSVTVAATAAGQGIHYTVANASILPTGLTLDANTGVISGTLPPVTTDTVDSFDLVATSVVTGKATTRSFSITIINDLPPVWSTAAGLFLDDLAGTSFTKSLLAIDPNGTTVTYTIANGTLPGSVTFNPNAGGGTASLSGTLPTVANNTTYAITVGASDGASQVNRTFSFTSELDVPPVWSTNAGVLANAAPEFSTFSTTVTAVDPNGKGVVYGLANSTLLPTGLSLQANNGLISGTLPAVANALANDTYNFTVRASDGVMTADRNFSIVVKPDAAPVWVTNAGSIGSVLESQTFSTHLVASDPDGDTVTYSLTNGTTMAPGFSLLANGFVSGRAGTTTVDTSYPFDVAASDGHKSTNRSFTLTLQFDTTNLDANSASVTMLMPFEGTPGSNALVDQLGHVITDNGAVISSTQVQFGNTAVFFNGSSSFTTPMLPDFNMLNVGVYTVEFWLFPTENSSTEYLISENALGNDTNVNATYWGIKKSGTSYALNVGPQTLINASSGLISVAGGTVLLNQWQHIAVCKSAAGTKTFLNGVNIGTAAINGTSGNTATNLVVGLGFTGYMDDLRITNAARYSANFTPGKAPAIPVWVTPANTVLVTGSEGNSITNAVALSFTDSSGLGIKNYVTVGALPTGVTLDTSNGTVVGVIPQAVQGGQITLTAQGKDGNNNLTAARNFIIQSNALSAPSDLQVSWRFNKQTSASGFLADIGNSGFGTPTAVGTSFSYVAAPSPHGTDTALQFNGQTAMYMSDTTNLRFLEHSNWTIEMWVWMSDFTAGKSVGTRLLSIGDGANGGNGIFWFTGGTGAIAGIYQNTYSSTFPQPTNGAWNHMALVRNGNQITAYTNGVAGAPGTITGEVPANNFDNLGLAINGHWQASPTATFSVAGTIVRGLNMWSTSKYNTPFTPVWDDFLTPVWANASANIANGLDGNSFNASVLASSFGNTSVTYAVSNAGTMPAGLNLVSNGYVYGTIPTFNANAPATSFSLIATDTNARITPPKTFTVTSLDAKPVWVSNGSLGNNTSNATVSLQLVATDPRGDVPVTYAVANGAIPAGLTLNSNGLITGSLTFQTTDTVSSFTVNAVNHSGKFSISNSLSYTVFTDFDVNFANTMTLLHADGNFTNSGNSTVTWSAGGTATVQNSVVKFGTGAFSTTGVATSWVRSSNLSSLYNLGTRPFTTEFWVNVGGFVNTSGAWQAAILFYGLGNTTAGNQGNGFGVFVTGTSATSGIVSVGAGGWNAAGTAQSFSFGGNITANLNQWYHVAAQRDASNNFSLYWDGQLVGATTAAVTVGPNFTTSYVWNIGTLASVSGFEYPLVGKVDDVRITYDVARYTGNSITVPNKAFPNTGPIAPVFTSPVSLGTSTKLAVVNTTVVATASVANATPITYSLVSGSLPGTATLASNGLISGLAANVVTDTVDTFTIAAADTQTHISNKTFTYTTLVAGDQFFSNVSLLIHGETTANNGVVIDSVGVNTFSTNNAANVSTAASKFGNSAVFFNGANSTTNVMKGLQGPPTWLSNWLSGTDFTLEAWINPTDLPNLTGGVNKTVIMCVANPSTLANYWQWTLSGSNATTITNMDWVTLTPGTVTDFHTTVPAGSIPMNAWTHIALTRANGVVRGFVNGVLLGNSIVNTSAYNGPSSLFFELGGETLTGAPGNFHGYMDEVRITTGTARYTANFTVSANAFPNLLDPSPIWANSGSLGFAYKNSAINVQLAANSPINAVPLTYSLLSGSLPGTATLSNSGLLSGVTSNVSTDTVSTFTLRATDVLAHTTDRTFTYTTVANADVNFGLTSALFHMEDTPNSSSTTDTFTDATGRTTMVKSGTTATTSTATAKFGNSAMYFAGATSQATTGCAQSTVNAAGFGFGTNDFTVESWVNVSSFPSTAVVATYNSPTTATVTNVNISWILQLTGNATTITGIDFYNQGDTHIANTVVSDLRVTGLNIPTKTWTHFAITRQGQNLRAFVNGTVVGSTIITAGFSYPTISGNTLQLGGAVVPGFASILDGYLDEVRISNGVARYTANFSVQTSPFPSLIDPSPVWANSGSLGSALHNSPISLQLVANTTNAAPVTYTVQSGALPGTVTLASNGLVSGVTGNAATDTVSTFTVRATDTLTRFTDQTMSYTTIANSDVFYSNVSLLLHAEDTPNGTTIADSSGKQTFTKNSASVSTANQKFGNSALFFNGANTALMVSTSNPPGISFPTGTDFTVEMWFNMTSNGGSKSAVMLAHGPNAFNPANTNNIWCIQIDATAPGIQDIQLYNGAGGNGVSANVTNLPYGTWHHIAFARQGGTLRVFVNGVLNNTNPNTFNYVGSAATALTVGGLNVEAFSLNMNGYMDEVRITNGVARYVSNFSVATSAYPNLQDPTPIFTTNAVTFTVANAVNVSNSVVANSPVNRSLTYTLTSGSLANGTTMLSNGLITGQPFSVGNSVFTVSAAITDAPNSFTPTTQTITYNVVSAGWATALGDTVTLPSYLSPVYTATTGNNSNGFGVFSNLLPATGQYFIDVTLASGQDSSPASVGFLGLSTVATGFNFNTSANYKAWYYTGAWFGDATTVSSGDSSNLITGTYRIAIDRTNGLFYMQRTSGTPSTVRSAHLPGSGNLFLMMLPQSTFRVPGVTIINGGIQAGHGGLY